MTTPTFIRAVPFNLERAVNAKDLRRQTNGRIVWDVQHSGYETFLEAFRFARGNPAIHLEDDIYLTSNWRAKIEAVIAEHGHMVIQFFSSNNYKNREIGSRLEPGRTFRWTQCFYVPARLSEVIHDYGLTWHERGNEGSWYDTMMGECLQRGQEHYWQEVPGLVQHRAWKSVIGPRSTKRQSETFVP